MDETPKSAWELALEKLKQRDLERGEEAPAALTDDQKRRIAEIRKVHEARLAEREILHRSERAPLLADPEGAEKLARLEEEYARDRRAMEARRDAEIAGARGGAPAKDAAPDPGKKKKPSGAARRSRS